MTGIYGLIAYDVAQRTREIGVRIALGAPSSRIAGFVMKSALRVVVMGIGAGLLIAFGVGRVMMAALFSTSPFDPVVLGLTVLVLIAAAALASLIPMWRALRVSPAVALTSE